MRMLLLVLAMAIASNTALATEPNTTPPSSVDTQPTITLKWSARNEEAVYGYLIYRSENRQGPFLRLNSEIIHVDDPASEESVNNYSYVDTTVSAGETYYYYLDTISKKATKKRFSGVIKKTAPRAPAEHSDTQ